MRSSRPSLLALLANPGGVIRPNLFLVLLTMLAVVALMVSIHNEFVLGSTFRACRLLGFIAVLWLLTPWWGRSDFPLLRAHLMCLRVVLGTVLVGAIVAPGAGVLLRRPAFRRTLADPADAGGPLRSRPARVHRRAVVRRSRPRSNGPVDASRGGRRAGRHAHPDRAHCHGQSAWPLPARACSWGTPEFGAPRPCSASSRSLAATFFAPLIVSWLWRGQSLEEASQLTGRTKVWSSIFGLQRPWLEELFGSGLSNKSFNGLPIDSNWLAVYLDQGWFGVIIDAALLIILILLAATHRRGLGGRWRCSWSPTA